MVKNILVFVSGTSPAIITETVYALATATTRWIADEIVVFTTLQGYKEINKWLISNNAFANMCSELNIACELSKACLKVVKDNQRKLEDIRNSEDNLIFADFINYHIQKLTSNPNTKLYVSIAGGRKTMGYFLGNAMTLYGREQDKLLHVLINDPFSITPGFLYPTKYSKLLTTFNNEEVDSANAVIELAEIPFLRIRDIYPKKLIDGKAKFSDIVSNIQSKVITHDFKLDVNLYLAKIKFNDISINLTPFQIALYTYFAELKQLPTQYSTIKNIDPAKLLELTADVLHEQGGINSGRYEQVERTMRNKDFEGALRSHISKINSKLNQELEFIASNFIIDGIEINSEVSAKLYGIKIESKNISIIR